MVLCLESLAYLVSINTVPAAKRASELLDVTSTWVLTEVLKLKDLTIEEVPVGHRR